MEFNLTLKKSTMFFSFFLIFILLMFLSVKALSPGIKPVPGHLISDMAPPTGCSDGSVLTYSSGGLSCSNSGGSSSDLKFATITYIDDIQSDKLDSDSSVLPTDANFPEIGTTTLFTWQDLGIDTSRLKSQGYDYVTGSVIRVGKDYSTSSRTMKSAHIVDITSSGVNVKVYSNSGRLYKGLIFNLVFAKDSDSISKITCGNWCSWGDAGQTYWCDLYLTDTPVCSTVTGEI